MEKVNVVWDDVMLEETRRIYAEVVESDFEKMVAQEITDWRGDAAKTFWDEKLK